MALQRGASKTLLDRTRKALDLARGAASYEDFVRALRPAISEANANLVAGQAAQAETERVRAQLSGGVAALLPAASVPLGDQARVTGQAASARRAELDKLSDADFIKALEKGDIQLKAGATDIFAPFLTRQGSGIDASSLRSYYDSVKKADPAKLDAFIDQTYKQSLGTEASAFSVGKLATLIGGAGVALGAAGAFNGASLLTGAGGGAPAHVGIPLASAAGPTSGLSPVVANALQAALPTTFQATPLVLTAAGNAAAAPSLLGSLGRAYNSTAGQVARGASTVNSVRRELAGPAAAGAAVAAASLLGGGAPASPSNTASIVANALNAPSADPAVQQAADRERRRAVASAGVNSTIVTGSRGVLSPARTRGKTLLGQ